MRRIPQSPINVTFISVIKIFKTSPQGKPVWISRWRSIKGWVQWGKFSFPGLWFLQWRQTLQATRFLNGRPLGPGLKCTWRSLSSCSWYNCRIIYVYQLFEFYLAPEFFQHSARIIRSERGRASQSSSCLFIRLPSVFWTEAHSWIRTSGPLLCLHLIKKA